ncbi:MAG: sigma-70 family RNA polymerase sigma factor [Prosthecochloris sp.]|nr:sigma-70 family RNA polymerase sigma factor [Prosthecochloris sp.]
MPEIDLDISQRFRKGDLDALREIVSSYQHTMFRIGLKLLGNPDDAKDFAQDVFLHAWQKRDKYDSARPFQPWFFQLAFNLGRGKLRRRKFTVTSEHVEPDPVEQTAETLLIEQEERSTVQELLEQLKPDYRECLLLRFEADLKLEEIAEALDIPVGTVKTRLRRGLIAFKQLYTTTRGAKR